MNRLTIILTISLLSQNLLANEVSNTGTLYRVDTRGDDVIFLTGFLPFGDNDSVRDHSRGVSCVGRQENSNFISVSSDPEYAGNYARRLISLGHQTVYVYIINSRQNIYNMARSLTASGYSAGLENARVQSEWISRGPIETTSILGVRRYTGITTPPIINNPRYISVPPVINNNPYRSLEGRRDLPGVEDLVANINPRATTCMAATLSCFSLQSRTSNTCRYIEPYRKKTALLYSTFLFN
jgi:hypothetical protein